MGPTASGKSELAVAVAARLGDVEIVTADSMQVYRGMDIGTATPPEEARGGVVHHLFDVVDPDEDYDLSRYAMAAGEAVAAIESRGHRALLVGGTGLYVRAVVDGLTPPGRWPEVRAELEAVADTTALRRRLSDLDPAAAARIEVGNRRRVVRALEVTVGSGRRFSTHGPGLGAYPATRWRQVGLWVGRPAGAVRIAGRLSAMADAGLLDEVRRLWERPAGLSRTARQALGYRQLIAHLEGERSLPDALADTVSATRAFARRQRMWWRRDPRIDWCAGMDNPLAVAPLLLGDWATR